MTAPSPNWRGSAALYDAMAPGYDAIFAKPGYRRAYDRLAGEYVSGLLPTTPGTIVDAGCGTARWARRWLSLGHRVTGIEQSPEMIAELKQMKLGNRFTLIAGNMEQAEIAPASADLVVALGSMQYVADPDSMMRRFAEWVRPGGHVCVYTDSLTALVLELMRMGKTDEALQRLNTRRGVFRQGDSIAELHLFDRAALEAMFTAAGLVDIRCHGLLVTASAWDKARSAEAALADEASFLALERRLMADPAMADAGKHIIVSGRRPEA
ncbi:MAG TPA: class I SAM-dependent methyltransferase [Alphaproteobacteria bacterium]|nr:class I SAM-dependent methyltransferase [Alphaproteobacteria bacterium]